LDEKEYDHYMYRKDRLNALDMIDEAEEANLGRGRGRRGGG
jgi:hypothetical protein